MSEPTVDYQAQMGNEVYKAIVAITGELAKEGISKSSTNQQQGFKYRGIDQVYGALSPLLSKYSLCIMPRIVSKEVVERTNKNGTALFYTTVEAHFDVVSAIDGSRHTVTSFGEAMDSGDKSVGKAMSYAYKAMSFMLFAIPTEGDNDADAHSHEVAAKSPAPRQPSPPAPAKAPEKKPLSADQERYFPRVKAALDLMYGDDTAQKKTLLKRLTTFTNKEGAVITGIEDYRVKDGQGLKILCSQIEKMAADQASTLPSICSECHADPCTCDPIPY